VLHRATSLIVTLTSLIPLEASAQTREVESAKPIRESVMEVDYQAAPPTVEAMTDAATAIVVARYTGEYTTRRTGGPEGDVFTGHEFHVTDVIKTDERLERVGGHRVRVTLPGGDVESSGDVVRATARGIAALTPGHSYLLFLMDNPYTDALLVAWGPDGVMDITDGTVAPIAVQQQRHAGKDSAAFLNEIRSALKR
jgi:hypothetical protein